jgi:hypothetical protein
VQRNVSLDGSGPCVCAPAKVRNGEEGTSQTAQRTDETWERDWKRDPYITMASPKIDSPPMILLQTTGSARTRATSDDAGITIHKNVLHPLPAIGRYALPCLPSSRVPSLQWLCLQRLAEFPDEVHHLGVRLRVANDTLLATEIGDAVHDPGSIDPRLWATLVQVYDNLPRHVASFAVPLADTYVPLLQRIPATARFALLTVLDVPACRHVTDDTVAELRQLHSLAALDVSATTLSTYAITVLARTLQSTDDGQRRGPWGLRILRLRYCTAVDNTVYVPLARFPLLSVIGASLLIPIPQPTDHPVHRPPGNLLHSIQHFVPPRLPCAIKPLSPRFPSRRPPLPVFSSPSIRIPTCIHSPHQLALPRTSPSPPYSDHYRASKHLRCHPSYKVLHCHNNRRLGSPSQTR